MSKVEIESKEAQTTTDATERQEQIEDRRALLKKLGRLGLYTAPALLVTFQATKAAIPLSRL